MKRFYTDVAVGPDRGIALDGKPVRTPARAPLMLPTAALAEAVAEEWRAQGGRIDPASMPLTGLANAAIDRVAPDAARFAGGLACFAETELLAYRAEAPAPLVARQAAGWDPLLAWAQRRYDVGFVVTAGILHVAQPPATLARIVAAYAAHTPFALAALNPLVTISGSAVIALAVAEAEIDADAAWAAGNLDELWQVEQWGRDPLVEAGWADKRAALGSATRFLRLLDGRTSAP